MKIDLNKLVKAWEEGASGTGQFENKEPPFSIQEFGSLIRKNPVFRSLEIMNLEIATKYGINNTLTSCYLAGISQGIELALNCDIFDDSEIHIGLINKIVNKKKVN